MTRKQFEKLMTRLVGLKFPPDTMDTHWEALQDLPDELLEAAVSKAQKEADEFPSPRLLLMLAAVARPKVHPVGPEPDRTKVAELKSVTLPSGQVLRFSREWEYYCDECSDTGWKTFACGKETAERMPWLSLVACQRDTEHLSHEWVGFCNCRETNPAVKRKREKDLQMAAQRVKAKGDAA